MSSSDSNTDSNTPGAGSTDGTATGSDGGAGCGSSASANEEARAAETAMLLSFFENAETYTTTTRPPLDWRDVERPARLELVLHENSCYATDEDVLHRYLHSLCSLWVLAHLTL